MATDIGTRARVQQLGTKLLLPHSDDKKEASKHHRRHARTTDESVAFARIAMAVAVVVVGNAYLKHHHCPAHAIGDPASCVETVRAFVAIAAA
jgi:hypothetical protein